VIFADTSFFYPLFSKDDVDHERAREVFEAYRGRRLADLLLTTNYVVSETITLIRTTPPRSHAAAVKVGERLFAEKLARIHRASAEEERAAFEYLKRHQDKDYSFVDCLSFVVMEKLGIREALAVDEDFTHRFIAHPGPGRK
jgi:predicted nucleic acid-binding protein